MGGDIFLPALVGFSPLPMSPGSESEREFWRGGNNVPEPCLTNSGRFPAATADPDWGAELG